MGAWGWIVRSSRAGFLWALVALGRTEGARVRPQEGGLRLPGEGGASGMRRLRPRRPRPRPQLVAPPSLVPPLRTPSFLRPRLGSAPLLLRPRDRPCSASGPEPRPRASLAPSPRYRQRSGSSTLRPLRAMINLAGRPARGPGRRRGAGAGPWRAARLPAFAQVSS